MTRSGHSPNGCSRLTSMLKRQLTLACTVFCMSSALLFADSLAPQRTYTKLTENGRYVFVMLSPYFPEHEAMIGFDESVVRDIRDSYQSSGLYRAGNESSPLWTVDWYARSAIPLSDGVHLVRPGPWATSSKSEAVSFFAKGRIVRSYSVSDLVLLPILMPHTVSHFTWRAGESVDDASNTYTIVTKHWEKYTFDVETGKIIESISPPRLLLISSLVVFLMIGSFRFFNTR